MDLARFTPQLEDLLTSEFGFGLATATALQRATCRVIDGLPLRELAANAEVLEAFGPEVIAAYEQAPRKHKEVILLSAVRCAKSMICAAAAYRMARTCDVSMVKATEPAPRVSIISIDKDKAAATFEHLAGAIRQNPWMAATVFGEPTMESTWVKHAATGRPIEIRIVAGAKAGGAVVSRWSAGCICDEAPRMEGGDYVVNLVDVRNGVLPRLLPGAQVLYPGSPSAPDGPIYELVEEHWKKPGGVMVIWAPGWLMNPVLWTPEACEELKATNPDAYVTDCAARFASTGEDLFSDVELSEGTMGVESLPYDARHTYYAAMDPATRGNAWTLTIATRAGPEILLAFAKEWMGSKAEPLRPKKVLSEIAEVCARYHIKTITSDQWHSDSLADIARDFGLGFEQVSLTNEEKTICYLGFKTRLANKTLKLPNVRPLLTDLKRVKKRPTQAGGVSIVLAKTKDGRHCDFAPSAVLSMHQWLKDAAPLPLTEDQKVKKAADDMRKKVIARAQQKLKERTA